MRGLVLCLAAAAAHADATVHSDLVHCSMSDSPYLQRQRSSSVPVREYQ